MDNKAIREWYLMQISEIPNLNQGWIKDGLMLEERAKKAWEIRHEARSRAREMMEDPEEVEMLRRRDVRFYGSHEGPSFEYLVNEGREAGLEGDEIYEFIITASYRSNPEINKALRLG